jgi:hypothetical protein
MLPRKSLEVTPRDLIEAPQGSFRLDHCLAQRTPSPPRTRGEGFLYVILTPKMAILGAWSLKVSLLFCSQLNK